MCANSACHKASHPHHPLRGSFSILEKPLKDSPINQNLNGGDIPQKITKRASRISRGLNIDCVNTPPSRVVERMKPCRARRCPANSFTAPSVLVRAETSQSESREGRSANHVSDADSFNSCVGSITQLSRTKQEKMPRVIILPLRRSQSPRRKDRQSSRRHRQTRRHHRWKRGSPRRPQRQP